MSGKALDDSLCNGESHGSAMANYGDVTVDELLTSRGLRQEVAELLAMSEAALTRGINGKDGGTTLGSFYTPCPADLESRTVNASRGRSSVIERIAYFTGWSTGDVTRRLQHSNGNLLLPKAFPFCWPERPGPSHTASRRAVVLTALSLEMNAVVAHLSDVRESKHPTAGTIYEIGYLASDGGNWEIAAVEIGAGNLTSALETGRAIELYKPNVILFVGVAGGLKDVRLGDVVAATKVYGYEFGKDTVAGFQSRPELGMSSYALEQRARAVARRMDWVGGILGQAPPQDLKAHVGPIAAGEKVLASASSSLVEFLRSHYGDTLAVEMEGLGAIQAAHQARVDAIVIRGVSDLINDKAKSDRLGWQARAAAHAAAFAMQMLAKF